MGRPASITVRFSEGYSPASARLAQWHAISPRYAAVYEGLQNLARLKSRRGGIQMLSQLSGQKIGMIRPLLAGAKALGFVDEPMPDYFEVRTLPEIGHLSLEMVDDLRERKIPLFHGNNEWMPVVWELYVFWLRGYRRTNSKAYTHKRLTQEVGSLKRLLAAVN